jgi:hypothetical protein
MMNVFKENTQCQDIVIQVILIKKTCKKWLFAWGME